MDAIWVFAQYRMQEDPRTEVPPYGVFVHHANLALTEDLLAKTSMPEGKPDVYCPDDRLLEFLTSL